MGLRPPSGGGNRGRRTEDQVRRKEGGVYLRDSGQDKPDYRSLIESLEESLRLIRRNPYLCGDIPSRGRKTIQKQELWTRIYFLSTDPLFPPLPYPRRPSPWERYSGGSLQTGHSRRIRRNSGHLSSRTERRLTGHERGRLSPP